MKAPTKNGRPRGGGNSAAARRAKAKAIRESVARAEEEKLRAMTPQKRQIYLMNQKHEDRLQPKPEDRNRRYDE